MATHYERMSRAELICEISRLEKFLSSGDELPPSEGIPPRTAAGTLETTLYDLQVYREAARVQTEQLLETQRLLEQSRDRFAELYDFAPLPYVTFNAEAHIEEINVTGADLLEADRGLLLGACFLDYLVAGEEALFQQHLQQCRSEAGPVVSELHLRRLRSGEVLPVQLSSRRAWTAAGDYTFRTAITDLSERQRVEQALRRSEERLTEANAALRQRTCEAETQAAQLRVLAAELTETEQRERRRLAGILHDHIQQLLVAAKIHLGMLRDDVQGVQPQLKLAEVVGLIEESVHAARSLAVELSPPILHDGGLAPALRWLARWIRDKYGLTVDVAADDQAEPAADVVRVLLFEMVRELLFNVVKHARVDRAQVEMVPAGDNGLRLLVADAGEGFDTAGWDAGDTSAGFGLVSIRQRLELLGGRIEVQSGTGRGTCVLLEAPSSPPADPPAPASVPAANGLHAPAPRLLEAGGGETADGERIRVLLADDHRIVREGLAGLLQRELDIQIVGEAADGEAAVELARQLVPDVIIMDIHMPRMNGVAATRQIAADLPQVRVIGLSLHEEADMADAMCEAGAARYLTKGGPSADLIAAIRGH